MGEQACVRCGVVFSDQASICPTCGEIVGAAAPTEAAPAVTLLPPPPPPPGSLSPGGGYAGPPAMATTSWQPAPTAAPKSKSGMVGAIAGVVAAIIAGVVFFALTKGAPIPELPPTLLGEVRATSPEAQAIEQSFVEGFEETDSTGKAAVYGTGAIPSFVAIIGPDPGGSSFEEGYRQFTEGVGSSGGTLNEAAEVDGKQGDWTIRCVPLNDAEVSVCVSGDGSAFLATVFIQEGDSTVSMTQTQGIIEELTSAET